MIDPIQILYLEDEANLEEMVRLCLEKEGITADLQRVATRKDFESAVSVLEHDLIIVDRILEDIDGFEAISLVRKTNKHIPIIMLSGTLDESLIVKALQSGASDYVLKQNIERLGTTIKAALEESSIKKDTYYTHTTNSVSQDIVNNIPGGIYQFKRNKNGSYSLPSISKQFQKLMGVSDDDVRDDATLAFEQVHPDDLPGLLESVEDSATSLSKWEYEFRVKRENGEYFWIKGMSMPRMQDGGCIIWSGILLDINNQKLTEQALRQSENSIRAILNNLDETFYRVNNEGHIILVSSSAKPLLGYSNDELLYKNHSELFSDKKDYASFINSLKQHNGSVKNHEAALKHKDGHTIWVATSAHNYKNEHGKNAGIEGVMHDISEKHYADVALRKNNIELEESINAKSVELQSSQNFLQAVLDTALDGIITIDSDGIIQSANPSIAVIFGYKKNELLGKNINILMPEPYYSQHDSYLVSYLKTGEAKIIGTGRTISGRRKNGEIFPLELSIAEIKANDNRYFTGVIRDITQQVNIQNELITKEKRYRDSQGFANIGTWDWNIQTGDLYWSERIATLFGYPEGNLETTYENFLASVHPDDRANVINAVNNCVEHGAEYNIEHRCVWPNGEIRWLLEKGDVVRDENNNALQMLGVVQDITDRKLAEQALLENQQLLFEAQKTGKIGNWSLDIPTGQLSWSDEIYRIFGVAINDFKPSYENFMSCVHPDDIEQIKASEKKAFKNNTKYSIDHRIILPDGEIRWVHEEAVTKRNIAGDAITLSGTVQDITERKHLEQALLSEKEIAEKANQAKSTFLSSMSHELRTPLNAIMGFSQLLAIDENLSNDHRENINEIYKAGAHLLELVNDVLDLSKIESGHIELSMEKINLSDILEECVLLNTSSAEKYGVSLEFNNTGDKTPLYTFADRTRLKQVIINLISNAIKYNRQNGHVYVSYEESANDQVKITVRDTGKGIAENKMPDLYLPFNRLSAEKSDIEGTGIGLIITKTLVECMGGTLTAESKLNEGSTFSFTLNSISKHSGDTSEVEANKMPTKRQTVMNTDKTIIYIEDNPTNLKLIEQLIQRKGGIEFLAAMEPKAGIDLINQHKPDLILLDINLPGMNGFEVLKIIKSNPETNNIPVIAVSANAMKDDLDKGEKAGFADYITKPVDIHLFYSKLEQYLD